MAFKPLKDDEELSEVIGDLTRVSEECAIATEAVNRATRAMSGMTPAGLLVEAERLNVKRKATRHKLLAVINDRVTKAYNAGLSDGSMQYEKRGS